MMKHGSANYMTALQLVRLCEGTKPLHPRKMQGKKIKGILYIESKISDKTSYMNVHTSAMHTRINHSNTT